MLAETLICDLPLGYNILYKANTFLF